MLTKYISYFVVIVFCVVTNSFAQSVSLNLVEPKTETNIVTNPKQFITGTTCKECTIAINGAPVKVYNTGAFAFPINLSNATSSIVITAKLGKKSITKTIIYNYSAPKAIVATDSTIIENITTEPNSDASLMPGEYVTIKVKAKPNCTILLNEKTALKEIPKSQSKGVAGYYQTTYKLKESDTLLNHHWKISLLQNGALKDTKLLKNKIAIWNTEDATIGETTMRQTPVYTGLGEDRLGGAKAGFLDSAVQIQLIGSIHNLYKVKLSKSLTVYIPKSNVAILNDGTGLPNSLSNNITVVGDSIYDYVKIGLTKKLPYLSTQNKKPNQIVLDLFGATSNSNWLMQYPETLQEITEVELVQVSDGQLRLTIDLLHKNLWGYKMYYEGNTLVLQVRRQKQNLSLQNMFVAIDAGHGGTNDGARGITGKYEKEFTLLLAKELEKQLAAEGVTTLMTRIADVGYENLERLKMLRKKMPDFAISIHLNSAGDPIRVKGVSTYYKYNAMKGLSAAIYKRVQETGLKGWGNIGNFNFFLNSATEFPTALVETLFISNPEEEEKVYDPIFRTQFVEKIVLGIKDWLAEIEKN